MRSKHNNNLSVGKRLLVVAGETSGDFYAASLINMLKERGSFDIYAIGGDQTKKCDAKMLYDSTNWAAIGLFEAIKQAPRLLLVLRKLKQFLVKAKPDLLVLVDYPGFNMRLVHMAQALGIPTIYIFPPSKFAKDPRLVMDAAKSITKVAANFASTYEVYKAAGADVKFVGHPLLDYAKPELSREETFEKYGLDPKRPVIALCPGSRKSELDQLLPVMLDAAKIIEAKYPEFQYVVPVIETDTEEVFSVQKSLLHSTLKSSGLPIKLAEGKIYDIMNVSEILLISSGTATLEASYLGVPMIICYKVSFFTEVQARLFYKLPKYIGLPNLIIERMAAPELIQHDFTPQKLANKAFELLESEEKRIKQKQDFDEVRGHLGEPGVLDKVVAMVFEILFNKTEK